MFAQVVAELHGLLDASAYLSDIRIFAVVEVASHHFVCARCLDEFDGAAMIVSILRRDDLGNSSLFPVQLSVFLLHPLNLLSVPNRYEGVMDS